MNRNKRNTTSFTVALLLLFLLATSRFLLFPIDNCLWPVIRTGGWTKWSEWIDIEREIRPIDNCSGLSLGQELEQREGGRMQIQCPFLFGFLLWGSIAPVQWPVIRTETQKPGQLISNDALQRLRLYRVFNCGAALCCEVGFEEVGGSQQFVQLNSKSQTLWGFQAQSLSDCLRISFPFEIHPMPFLVWNVNKRQRKGWF